MTVENDNLMLDKSIKINLLLEIVKVFILDETLRYQFLSELNLSFEKISVSKILQTSFDIKFDVYHKLVQVIHSIDSI